MNTGGIDFIGDIHGYADELEHLLKKLGYSRRGGAWKHPHRVAFFVGDFIDRGPKNVETVHLVRSMIENGSAKAVMGNHEYNAICFNRKNKSGEFLRKHSTKNIKQHEETKNQFDDKEDEYEEMISWFETLPLFYETEDFRVVHATWDHGNVEHLKNQTKKGVLSEDLIEQSALQGSQLYHSVDTLLKGKELTVPNGKTFMDKDGHKRNAIRIKWWVKPDNHTYESISIENIQGLPNIPVQSGESLHQSVYGRDERPVFFGHYWLRGKPGLYRDNICCLDYSVAKGGKLVAYRFDGEERLSDKKLVYV